ncbi:hypothetical protein TOK_5385 [Pseudonocardia sp. N23]|nr:hypothetical protein TOK_5385 [Pseudonocardia sp. N23]
MAEAVSRRTRRLSPTSGPGRRRVRRVPRTVSGLRGGGRG